MAAQAIRLQNPKVFDVPEVEELFQNALKDFAFFDGAYEDAKPELMNMVKNENIGIMLGFEKGEFKGIGMVLLPNDQFSPIPQVPLFYNEGSMAIKRCLVSKIVDFVVDAGYTKFRVINNTDKADSIWARGFWRTGTSKRVGSIMEFQIG